MLESYKEKVFKFKSEKVESKLVTSSQVKTKLSKKGGSKLSSMEGSSQVGVVQDKLVKECKWSTVVRGDFEHRGDFERFRKLCVGCNNSS